MLLLYVYLWAPLRDALRSLCGRSHTVILNYHRVSDEFRDAVTVGLEQFRRQARILRRGWDVQDMASFLSRRGRPRRRTAVVITFDDGYEDNYRAAEILRQASLPCTFFISTGIVGTDKAFPHDIKRLARRVAALDWDQVREMAEWGFAFANHGVSHSNMGDISFEQAVDEITTASADIRRETGQADSARWFSYPHGRPEDITDDVREALGECGIEACFSAYGGTNRPNFDILDIRRQGVNHQFSDLGFKALLRGWRVSA